MLSAVLCCLLPVSAPALQVLLLKFPWLEEEDCLNNKSLNYDDTEVDKEVFEHEEEEKLSEKV